ncbi:outer membrane lipoprotein-sorting protein [Siphonobacter aquaeclarae]|jgi:hypothetical protein|uniref:Uncharacterized protein TP-0789 domain-containing protein n=1 Tax=Siphonobacter aquaeclarae TaxID=563176 RepID=A0A1G9L216_9BACT|nr:outer membrane lipoprotein-sorting protein [Siphonobacter aquaeclarae]SDL55836.1 hypothetical protein SAMN04488090_1214 [Siphonobacter aquaeclarae]
MNTLRFWASSVALVVTLSAQAQTVDEIIDKHIAARGGADKLKNIKTLVVENSMSMQGMDIPMKQIIVSGRGMRMEISVMGNDMITAVDGDKGWMIRPAMMGGTGEPEDLPADQIKSSKRQMDPAGPLFNYKEKGSTVALVGKEKLDKKDVYHLKITTEGNAIDYFIDADTYLLSKQVANVNMNGQETSQEMAFSDYKPVDGIQFAHTMETSAPMGGGSMVITINKVVVNGPVDDKLFTKPAK